MFKGKSCYPYNVGSDEDLTIAELAEVVASTFALKAEVVIAKEPIPGKPVERYVPSVQRAFAELQLKPLISLSDSIIRTASYNSSKF